MVLLKQRRRHMGHGSRLTGLTLLLLLASARVQAAWTPNGVNLSNTAFTSSSAYFPNIASDDSSGAIVVWQHQTGFPNFDNVRTCRVDAAGTIVWTRDVCDFPGVQKGAKIVETGDGGALLVWEDERSTGQGPGIYAQRVDSSGTDQWAMNGVRVVDVLPWDRSIRIVSDGSGGAYIVWYDERAGNGMTDVYIQRIYSDGTTWGAAGGYPVGTPTQKQWLPDVVADGAGGVVVAWQDGGMDAISDSGVHVQRIDGSANLMWGAAGTILTTADTWSPQVAMSGVGSCVVTWIDESVAGAGVLVQKLDAGGVPLWAAGGVHVSTSIAEEVCVAGDGGGGAFAAWTGEISGPGYGILAARVESSGTVLAPVEISAPASHDEAPSIVEDGAGGAFLLWRKDVGGSDDISGQWLDPNGQVRFAAGGVALCDTTGTQWYPGMALSGVGRAVTVWWDGREFGYADVFAQIMEGNTNPGPSSQVAPVDSTTGTTPVTLTFDNVTSPGVTSLTTGPAGPPLPGTFSATGTYYHLTTNATFTDSVEVCVTYDPLLLSGPEWDVKLTHYDGVMWIDITTSVDTLANVVCGRTATLSPFVVGTGQIPTAVGDASIAHVALRPNVPNPFNPQTTIQYEIPAGGADVNISIYDVAGRLVRALVAEHRGPGTWSVQWNGDDDRGRRVASGVYFYRMRAGSFVDTKKMVLLK
jgi:hypothetical protein